MQWLVGWTLLVVVAVGGGRRVLQFNLMRVEICELRPEVVAEDEGVLVHY